MIRTKTIIYSDSTETYEGAIAWDASIDGKRPVVMIAHAYGGQSEFDINKAKALAELGYVGFAIDVYGKGKRGTTVEESSALMAVLNEDRPLLLKRMQFSLAQAKGLDLADESKIAIIGFCFGGKCLLDLVRSGEQLSGGVSFHGVYDPPGLNHQGDIKTPVVICHGWDDPLATPAQTVALAEELTARNANWEINAYGHTGHAFTNPGANRPADGMMYNQQANDRSWEKLVSFLEEVF